jgi:tRNA pseudouridine32 synthase/23S rRNA pseudouridine746 synthase
VYAPAAGTPALVHLDDHLAVVDKPSGLLSVPGRGEAHRDSALLRLESEIGTLWVVHRLDMDTSGLIVYARSREAAAGMGRLFEARRVHKVYHARVQGAPPADEGTIDRPLRLDWPHRPRQVVDPDQGKPALTRFRVLQRDPTTTRVELQPLTGRSHQLRVHLASIGCPIVGDRFYGPATEGLEGPHDPVRLMLHAAHLEFEHPLSGQRLSLQAPTPF